ncbi:immunity protein Imm33 domain-containing protein [Brachybacterium sp. DNPG3]
MCRRFGLAETVPEPKVALALSSIGATPVYGTRIALEEGDDVSWFLHCGEYSEAADFYQPVHLEHLPELLPIVLPYLRLPPGARFIIDADGYVDVWLEP